MAFKECSVKWFVLETSEERVDDLFGEVGKFFFRLGIGGEECVEFFGCGG